MQGRGIIKGIVASSGQTGHRGLSQLSRGERSRGEGNKMFDLKAANHTSRAEIESYNMEEPTMPTYGYWLFRDGHAIGWYAKKEFALGALYDLGFNKALSLSMRALLHSA